MALCAETITAENVIGLSKNTHGALIVSYFSYAFLHIQNGRNCTFF